ncbi:hypothetical protein K388_00435 [Streptomyces sp. KhCrAH-43]|uniref:hypothetical protein n=1 Tax=unclassified Streptomyces TaxID=2593676 RepID=UPI00037A62F2|nr:MULTISPECIES: hypothetical protein [unclassified Streptomyces]MYS38023.1 hypothetical protein [Streptomyces sp. SID4920]MYX66210.1 hypothetical protein [Streptomyces sp. SID8373]RAJ67694.1 hypothetical protein K388_00435 [Streptomyces sp. KhCrAH-43]
MSDVRELLGRAAEDAGRPVISTEAVYAKAARVRWRRRAAVSAAAVCAVAAGAFVVPQLASSSPKAPQTSSVASSSKQPAAAGRAARLTGLLPDGVGTVEEVSFAEIIKHVTPAPEEPPRTGPLDGQYAVRRDGGVGYLTIDVMDAKAVRKKLGGSRADRDLCHPANGEPAPAECVREELSGGRVLTIWSDGMDHGEGTPQWGPELVARLGLADGSLLAVRDSTGFEADVVQGPLLKTPPLTRAQLRELVLRTELLPGK